MPKVNFKRKSTTEIETLPIEDGALIYDYETGNTYMDYEESRIQTGGKPNENIYRQSPNEPDSNIPEEAIFIIEEDEPILPLPYAQVTQTLEDSQEKAPSGHAVLEKVQLKPTILWTNPTPTNVFAAQTISINLNDYNFIEIIYLRNNSSNYYFSTGLVPVLTSSGARLESNYSKMYFRNTNITKTSIQFTDAAFYNTYGSSDTTTENDKLVPIYIIGHKI